MFERIRELFGSDSDLPSVLTLVWFLIAIGLLSLLIPSWAQKISGGWVAALTVLSSGLFLAGASTVTGSLVGFLFGVPRYRRLERDGHAPTELPSDFSTAPNTNLEQISDWLSKIIVGVGLTQIPEIGRFFEALGRRWGAAFGPAPAGEIIAISITVHYLVMGFFQGFLLSSLWMPGAIAKVKKRLKDQEQ
jgi:hypothetical protein